MDELICIIKATPHSHEKEVYKIIETNKIQDSEFGFFIKNKKTKKVFLDRYSLNGKDISWFFNQYLHKNEMIVGSFQLGNQNIKQPSITRQRVYSVFSGNICNFEELKEKYKLKNIQCSSELIGSLYYIKYTSCGNDLQKTIINLDKDIEGLYFFMIYDDLLQKMIIVNNYLEASVSYKRYDHYFICSEEPEDMFYEFRQYPFLFSTVIDFNKLEIENHIEL